jgi:hypothetical protein
LSYKPKAFVKKAGLLWKKIAPASISCRCIWQMPRLSLVLEKKLKV